MPMNCHEVISQNIIERYLDGSLDELTRDAFEEHYFQCQACLTMVQTVQTVRPALTPPDAPTTKVQPIRRTPWIWLAAAAAALTVALIFLRPWPQAAPPPVAQQLPTQTPAPLQLAQIQPAPYSPNLFRDAATQPPEMERAMRLYQDQQWAAAAAALTPLAGPPYNLAAARHFAGISFLLAGQSQAAINALQAVVALGDQSPFEEEARFYHAQALLLAGRLNEAKLQLDQVIKLRGDYETKARSLQLKL
jgi:anti-sigma factor RsiW